MLGARAPSCIAVFAVLIVLGGPAPGQTLVRTYAGGPGETSFARCVAIDGSMAVVGSCGADAEGRVHVFDLDADTTAPTHVFAGAATYNYFGRQVALEAGEVTIGAYEADTPDSAAVKASGLSASGGAALFSGRDAEDPFRFAMSVDGQRTVLSVSSAGAGPKAAPPGAAGSPYLPGPIQTQAMGDDGFGWSCDVDDGLAAVGAPWSGRVYLYDLSEPSGPPVRTVEAPNGEEGFGCSVALSDGLLLVGACGDDTGGPEAGKVLLFDLSDGALLTTLVGKEGERLGYALDARGDWMVVGSAGSSSVGLYDISTIPEPATVTVLSLGGLAALLGARRRRARRRI